MMSPRHATHRYGVRARTADLCSQLQYRTSRQNDAMTTGEHAQIGTYVLVTVDGTERRFRVRFDVACARSGVSFCAP
jgi:hypothetical protein